ncbi:MAG: peptidoglycan-binding domain-containing protein [Acidimicrobiia bacterium]|nr:MAG: peptidoglycan-binding domain-containing protein [Acidimicrobiia bacterium]
MAVVSGRPVIVLGGEFPLYRDLERGMEGPDVSLIQEALIRLGYLDAEADGVFGRDTEIAVAALYEHLGFDPSPPPGAGGDGMPSSKAPKLRMLIDEIVIVEGLPAIAAAIETGRGQRVDPSSILVRLVRGEPLVSVTVRGAPSNSVVPGSLARVLVDAAGLETVGEVVSVGEQQADLGEGISREVILAVRGLEARHVGMLARAVLTTAETEDEVLAAPVASVFTDASGVSNIILVIEGVEVSIPVTPGRVIGGFVELVDPDERIEPGLPVVVGWR